MHEFIKFCFLLNSIQYTRSEVVILWYEIVYMSLLHLQTGDIPSSIYSCVPKYLIKFNAIIPFTAQELFSIHSYTFWDCFIYILLFLFLLILKKKWHKGRKNVESQNKI